MLPQLSPTDLHLNTISTKMYVPIATSKNSAPYAFPAAPSDNKKKREVENDEDEDEAAVQASVKAAANTKREPISLPPHLMPDYPSARTSRTPRLLPGMRADYNFHSQFQHAVFQASCPYITLGVESYDFPLRINSNSQFTIVDYGSSTGANSSCAADLIISLFRKRCEEERRAALSITVVHNDLPSNPWSSLFQYVETDPASYLSKHSGVFCVASGHSFYEQILPSQSVQFGFSNASLHWASEVPVKISNHCFSMFSKGQELRAFQKQAEKDWREFLTARAAELTIGGILVVQCCSAKDSVKEMWNSLYVAAQKLYQDGLITADELLNYNYRIVWRDPHMFTNSVLLKSLGLEVIAAEQSPIEMNPIYAAYQTHNDTQLFSHHFTSFVTSWAEPTFVDALDANRSEKNKNEICTQLWKKYRELVEQQPDCFQNSVHNMFVVLRKVKKRAANSISIARERGVDLPSVQRFGTAAAPRSSNTSLNVMNKYKENLSVNTLPVQQRRSMWQSKSKGFLGSSASK